MTGGRPTAADAHLTVSTPVSGKIISSGPPPSGSLQAFDTLPNTAGQQLVRVRFQWYDGTTYRHSWHRTASTFVLARPVPVRPATPATGVDIVVPSS